NTFYLKTLFSLRLSKYPSKYLQVILGGLFYNESVGLLSDLPAESANIDKSNWQDLYYQNALNSWIAGAIHLAIFVAAGLRLCCLR
uniref:Uncharacterized protein n=1 Tax=Parascaris equorum TaxID=6256 RepID=A0A914RVK1_PAREQ